MKSRSAARFFGVWSAFLAVGTWFVQPTAARAPASCVLLHPHLADPDHDQLRSEFEYAFGVSSEAAELAVTVPSSFDPTGSTLGTLRGQVFELLPRISTEITQYPEIQLHAEPGERVFTLFADVCTANSIVLAKFLVRSFADHSQFWFTGIASEEFLTALAVLDETELRSTLLTVSDSVTVELDGLLANEPPSGNGDDFAPSSDCARLARRLAICQDAFRARAQLAQSGLIERLELLSSAHDERIAGCEHDFAVASALCAEGRDSAVAAAERALVLAKQAALDERELAVDAARSARRTAMNLAVATEVGCIAAAQIGFYACLATAGWTGVGVIACTVAYLALQVVCHTGFVYAVQVIDRQFQSDVTRARAAYDDALAHARAARDAAVAAADQNCADCLSSAAAAEQSCIRLADLEFNTAACLELQSANQMFREAVIALRECVALTREEFAEVCPLGAEGVGLPVLDFLEGVGVEGCDFEWPPPQELPPLP